MEKYLKFQDHVNLFIYFSQLLLLKEWQGLKCINQLKLDMINLQVKSLNQMVIQPLFNAIKIHVFIIFDYFIAGLTVGDPV